MPYFSDSNFPANMPAIWDKQIGWLEGTTGKAGMHVDTVDTLLCMRVDTLLLLLLVFLLTKDVLKSAIVLSVTF
jgi:hypothetical protein